MGILTWIGFLIQLFFLKIIYSYTPGIAGWSFYEMLLLSGIFDLIWVLTNVWILNPLQELPEKIYSGSLDFDLLKPVNTQVIASFSRFSLLEIIVPVLLPLFLIVYSIVKIGLVVAWWQIVGGVLMLAVSLFILYCFSFLLVSCSFFVNRFHTFRVIFNRLREALRYPLHIYPLALRIVLLTVIPIGVAIFYPVKLLVEGLGAWEVVLYICVAGFFFLVSRLVFLVGLKRYSSASS